MERLLANWSRVTSGMNGNGSKDTTVTCVGQNRRGEGGSLYRTALSELKGRKNGKEKKNTTSSIKKNRDAFCGENRYGPDGSRVGNGVFT